jgi:YD repeat-containing protein
MTTETATFLLRFLFDYNDRFGVPKGEARSNTAPAELAGQASYAFATRVTNALGHTAYTQYDYYLGRPIDAEDPNGIVSSASYNDPLDRPTQVVRAVNTALRNQTSFSYNDIGRAVAITRDLEAFGDNKLRNELIYDSLGQTIETRRYETSSNSIMTQTRYDALGRTIQVSNPYRPGEDMVWTTTQYDGLGRVVAVTTPDGARVTTTYHGSEATVTDQAGKTRRSASDALGRLVRVIEDPNELAYQTSYTYDVLDNLTSVAQGEQTRHFLFDSVGRLTEARNPESDQVRFVYDNNGNLKQKTDARGVVTRYDYDALNRVTMKSYSDGTSTVTYTYDTSAVPNATGRLTSVSSAVSSSRSDEYDALGRVKRSTQVTDGQSYTMSYGYDLAGNVIMQTYPSGRVVTTSYDTANRLSGVSGQKSGEGPKTYASSFSYTAHAGLQAVQLGNGLWEHTRYNARLQPIQIGLGTSSTDASVLQLDYAYGTTNNNGNVLSQTIIAPGFSATQTYTYDPLNRLKTATEEGSWTQTYLYDQYGNRAVTGYVPNPALTPQAVTDFNPATNRLTNSSYDNAGNLTQDATGRIFDYDAENHQVTFNTGAATYAYDGDGRRVKTVVGRVTTVFVYNAFGQLVAEYAHAEQAAAGGTSYLTTDHLGSTRLVTDGGRQMKARSDYLPFGEEISSAIGGRSAAAGYNVDNQIRQKFGLASDSS